MKNKYESDYKKKQDKKRRGSKKGKLVLFMYRFKLLYV